MASQAEITQQIVALNATVGELQARAAEAKNIIEAQHTRIGTLEASAQGGGRGGGHEYKRRVDLKVLAPEPFTAKDEHRWREWAEEFEDYVEGIDARLAGLMRSAPDEDSPIAIDNLDDIDRSTLTDIWALMTKMLKHSEAKLDRRRWSTRMSWRCGGSWDAGSTHKRWGQQRPA